MYLKRFDLVKVFPIIELTSAAKSIHSFHNWSIHSGLILVTFEYKEYVMQ